MDLDELRDALNEAGDRTTVDEIRARAAVGGLARRHRRNRRISVSIAALAAVAVVVGSIIAVGTHGPAKPIVVTNKTPPAYATLPSRSGAAMAYDDATGKVVLFGGAYASGSRVLNDTWLWDGHGWYQANPGASPPARTGAVMSYDPASKNVVLFGGTQPGTGAPLNDTWTWDGTTWTQQHPAHSPHGDTALAMSYDPRSRSMLLVTPLRAAASFVDSSLPFGTWLWDGSDWHGMSATSSPLWTTDAGVVYTSPRLTPLANGAGLLFDSWANLPAHSPIGTVHAQTWTWDGTHWIKQPTSPLPIGPDMLVVTPGPAAQPTIFDTEGPTWRWDGSLWGVSSSSTPAPTLGGGPVVYDAHDGNVVAYVQRVDRSGLPGATEFFDTWTWNGSWTNRTGASAAIAPTVPTSVPTTPTTTAPTSADPLPAGSVMLGVSGRTISALDAHGAVLKTLVTAFAGRTVQNAQLMPDHRTIWYATKADDNQSCPEIVKLDLQTNARTVVAHASDFSLTPDGSKLLLVWPASAIAVTNNCRPVPYPSGVQIYDGAFVVRDLATGAQSTLAADKYPTAGTGSPTGHVWISPAGDRLIDGSCVLDGCGNRSWTVPPNLVGPIVLHKTTIGVNCGCSTLVSGPDGVYGVDQGNLSDPHTVLRRYDPTNLSGTGTTVVAPTDVILGASIAPTAEGVFVLGFPIGTQTNLYRVDNGALQLVKLIGPSTTVTQIVAIPPFAG